MKAKRVVIIALCIIMLIGCAPVSNPIITSGPNVVSQKGGYVVKTDCGIFCIDDRNIYHIKDDGSLSWLRSIPEVRKIVPYEDRLVYIYEPTETLYSCNDKFGGETILSKEAIDFFKVIDGYAYYRDKQSSLKRVDLNGKSAETIEETTETSGVTEIQYSDGYLCYLKRSIISGNNCEIISYNCRTEEKKVIAEEPHIEGVFMDNNYIFFDKHEMLNSSDKCATSMLYRTDRNGKDKIEIIKNYGWIYLITNNNIVSNSLDGTIHIYNYEAKTDEVICKESNFEGYDDNNCWYYYIENNSTYRIKDDGSKRELFCDFPLAAGYYNSGMNYLNDDYGMPVIDDWIYYYEDYCLLKRVNINTKEVQEILKRSESMPWWNQI